MTADVRDSVSAAQRDGAPIDRVLARLEGVKRRGAQIMAKCPAHADSTASLSVRAAEDGKVLLHCFAGCVPEAVLNAAGLTMGDLFPAGSRSERQRWQRRWSPATVAVPRQPESHPRPEYEGCVSYEIASIELAQRYRRRLGQPARAITRYHYFDGLDPVPVLVVFRIDLPNGKKEFCQASRNAHGRVVMRGLVTLQPMFRLREVLAADANEPAIAVEGEKACLAAAELGFLAVTGAGGAEAAGKTDWSPLAGRELIVLPDADEPGEKWAADVVRLARSARASSVRILRLPDAAPGSGDDVADFIDRRKAMGCALTRVVDELVELIEGAPLAPEVA